MEDDIYPDGPHLRRKGLPVWVLVGYYQFFEGDKEKTLGGYTQWLTYEDLEAALAYYEEHPQQIDEHLQSLEQD